MSRSLRLEFPGALWHVMSRGVEKRDIFLDVNDRCEFLGILADVVARFHWRLHAYVLMTNHYHVFVETAEPTLSLGMQKLGGAYAEKFNWRYDRVGHLFQGRFKAHLVDSDAYFLEVARYIVLNPVRAGMVAVPEEWEWSSYRATAGFVAAPSWLTVDRILERLHPSDRMAAMAMYREFVAARCASPWKDLVGQIYLGGAEFVERVQERIDECRRSEEHPCPQRVVRVATLEDVERVIVEVTGTSPREKGSKRARIAFAALAQTEALARLHQIGAVLGIKPTAARYLIDRADELRTLDEDFARLLGEVRLKIRNCKL